MLFRSTPHLRKIFQAPGSKGTNNPICDRGYFAQLWPLRFPIIFPLRQSGVRADKLSARSGLGTARRWRAAFGGPPKASDLRSRGLSVKAADTKGASGLENAFSLIEVQRSL